MQAVSILAPALAPLAIRLIDKYVFDDEPKIIEVPAPPQYICCCGQVLSECDNETRACSTCCSTSASRYRPSKLHLSTKSTVRSSSTDGKKTESSCCRRTRTHSESDTKSVKKTHHPTHGSTLEVLAGHLKHEISSVNPKGKSLSRCHSKSKTTKTDVTSSSSTCGARKTSSKCRVDSKYESSQKHGRDSDRCKLSRR